MGASGDALRALITDATDARTASLLVEAGRISDRLDALDAIITGKSEWIKLMHFRVSIDNLQEVSVTIDGVLAEARQQATALKGILTLLGVPKVEAVVKKRSGLDELRARRAARASAGQAEAAGTASS